MMPRMKDGVRATETEIISMQTTGLPCVDVGIMPLLTGFLPVKDGLIFLAMSVMWIVRNVSRHLLNERNVRIKLCSYWVGIAWFPRKAEKWRYYSG
jgi:hypothetical protein